MEAENAIKSYIWVRSILFRLDWTKLCLVDARCFNWQFCKKYLKAPFLFTVSPEEMHPALVRFNEMIQHGRIKDSHYLLQQIDMFTSLFGNISEGPFRGQRNLHRRYPAAILLQESIREARSGRQAHGIYLGKHSIGSKGKAQTDWDKGQIELPDPNCARVI